MNMTIYKENSSRIVFFGTDEFARIVLKRVSDSFFVVKAITKPVSAKNLDLPPADLGVVAVYGRILPKRILEHFPHGILNIHPSLLPKYRGPSPIRTAIANGDTETGVTIIKLNEEMDAGPIVAQIKYQISNIKMHSEVRGDLAKLGADLLIKTIPDYIAGTITLQPQDESQATYTKLITRDDGKIDLEKDSPQIIYNKFRAYEGWPGIWMLHKNKRVKIIDCQLTDDKLELIQLQPEGKKPMSQKDFINGYGHLN